MSKNNNEMTLKEQLEKYMNNAFRKAMYDEFKNTYLNGFQDAMQLLYPLVEAHIKNANQDYRGHRETASVESFIAIQTLVKTLKGEG